MEQSASNRDERLSARAVGSLLCVAVLFAEAAWLTSLALAAVEVGSWVFG